MSITDNKKEQIFKLVESLFVSDVSDEAIINSVAIECNEVLSYDELLQYKKEVIRKHKEVGKELEIYLKDLVENGMYEDVRKQFILTNKMINYNYAKYIDAIKEGRDDDAMKWTNTLTKQFEDNRRIFTSMGFLQQTKEMIIQKTSSGMLGDKDNRDTTISIESKGGNDFDKVLENTVSELEIKENEVF